jgi:isopenicillin N synthase-like dioxygenase
VAAEMAKAPIPVIDFASFRAGEARAREQVARAIDRACTDIGFFRITGHGVD